MLTHNELMLNGTCIPNRVDQIERIEEKAWWNPTDPMTWFCFSLRSREKDAKGYVQGEMITFAYGKRTNASMLTFYGFCSAGNRYDSVRLQLNKQLKKEQRANIGSILQGLVLCNAAIEKRHSFINDNAGTKIAKYL